MISVQDKEKCCGCGACSVACPTKCIKMISDKEGFLYPKTDIERCINCNLCNKVCPIEAKKLEKSLEVEQPRAFGGWHKNEETRKDSSSGGAFTLFAENILKKGGIVFGCTLNENMQAVHIGVESLDELYKLRGSKYVQSDLNNTYQEIQKLVKDGRMVLFVGTPCEAAGLFSFMGNRNYDNLYIVDFICHGVPSPQIFKDYIEKEEKEEKSKLVSYRFRNKDYGWNQMGVQLGSGTLLKFENGVVVHRYPAYRDTFMNGFGNDIYLRPSCYACMFKRIPKDYADFTIGDFWGVDKVEPELSGNKGTSLLLINTKHGENLWKEVNQNFYYKEVDFIKAIGRNRSLVKSTDKNLRRTHFFNDYFAKGYDFVERKYMSAIVWAIHKIYRVSMEILKSCEQFVKFSAVGCSNVLINLGVYYLCVYVGIYYLVAYTAGFLVSVLNAFYWNNKFVFKNKKEKSILKAFLKVLASYGFSFILSIILMSVMVEALGISSMVAPILKMIITIPINFLLNKVWAFKDKRTCK